MWIVIFFIGMLVGVILIGSLFIAMEGYFTIVKNEEVETKTIYEKNDITSDVVVLGYCKVHKITYKNGRIKYKTYDI